MPTTSEQFVPEKRLPQAGARDAEVPSLQAGSCARTTGQGVACQGMPFCSNPRTMDRNLCSNALLGYFCHLFLKKAQANKKIATVLSWVSQEFPGGSSPPQSRAKASPCSLIRLGRGIKLPSPLHWAGVTGVPCSDGVVPGHGRKMLPTLGKGLFPLPASFSSDLCVPQKGSLISQSL